jgi:hypothetical protein
VLKALPGALFSAEKALHPAASFEVERAQAASPIGLLNGEEKRRTRLRPFGGKGAAGDHAGFMNSSVDLWPHRLFWMGDRGEGLLSARKLAQVLTDCGCATGRSTAHALLGSSRWSSVPGMRAGAAAFGAKIFAVFSRVRRSATGVQALKRAIGSLRDTLPPFKAKSWTP